jgi:putative tryptophan/tyrosine transport system substrate-binding protein
LDSRLESLSLTAAGAPATGLRAAVVAMLRFGAGLAVAKAVPAVAQSPGRPPRVSYFNPASPEVPGHAAFRKAMADLGYVEGRTILYEDRFGEGRIERLPLLAAELAALNVDVIVAVSTAAIEAARAATSSIPIVMAFASDDPVASGLVTSLARPGGNVTGLTLLSGQLTVKRLELLRDVVPRLSRVAMLVNPDAAVSTRSEMMHLETAAKRSNVRLQITRARRPEELTEAFAAMRSERAQGLIVSANTQFFLYRKRIIELASESRLPAAYNFKENAEDGGLLAYGPSLDELARRAASFVGRILKGARPSTLPIEQPATFDLVVNLKTARSLGITIPQAVLGRATHVIE